MYSEIKSLLRTDVLYFAVSQGNNGLKIFQNSNVHVLVLSSGGVGNIALPLIKGDLISQGQFKPYNKSHIKYLIGFYGTIDNGVSRKRIMSKVVNTCKYHNQSVNMLKSSHWVNDISTTLFNLGIGLYYRFRYCNTLI